MNNNDISVMLGISEDDVAKVEKFYDERVFFKTEKFSDLEKDSLEFYLKEAKSSGYL